MTHPEAVRQEGLIDGRLGSDGHNPGPVQDETGAADSDEARAALEHPARLRLQRRSGGEGPSASAAEPQERLGGGQTHKPQRSRMT